MSVVPITRLKPNQLQLLQVLAGSPTALISDCIKAMQASYASNLNTSCPTCAVNDNPTGFLPSTVQVAGKTIKLPCTTCNGYMLHHTAQGQLTPPNNPFSPTVISVPALLPADLNEGLLAFPSSTTLAAMITSLQANAPTTLTVDCPLCANGQNNASTGNIIIGNVSNTCPLCVGMQKTVRAYQLVNGIPVLIVPTIAPPDPLPDPYNPFQPT